MHTPGPWTIFYKAKYDEWHVSLPIAGTSFKLALAPDGIQSSNREDDAHLIAAAPDLLAALKLAADHIEHMATWIGARRAGYSFEGIGEDMPGIRAAIARATGGQYS